MLEECFVGTKANPNYGLTFWLNRSSDGSANVSLNSEGRNQRLQETLGIEPETTRFSEEGIGAKLPKDVVMAAGAGKQRLYVIPSQDLVIVRQGRQSRFDDREFLSKLLLDSRAAYSIRPKVWQAGVHNQMSDMLQACRPDYLHSSMILLRRTLMSLRNLYSLIRKPCPLS